MKQDFSGLMASAVRTQLGALCWRIKDGQLKILLVTSRETGRWVLPKGWPMSGKSNRLAAEQEAWEEAGVTGAIGPRVGSYSYDKVLARDTSRELAVPCDVRIYSLQVEQIAKRYPERKQRRRKWFPPDRAAALVAEPALAELLRGFVPPGA